MSINMISWKENGRQAWTTFYKDGRGECEPEICFGNLDKQFAEKKTDIELGMAYDCWKAVAVVKDGKECAKVMARYLEKSKETVVGKFGGKRHEGDTQAVIIYSKENEIEKAVKDLESSAKNTGIQNYSIFKRRGCERLQKCFGHWRNWKRNMKVKYVESSAEIPK